MSRVIRSTRGAHALSRVIAITSHDIAEPDQSMNRSGRPITWTEVRKIRERYGKPEFIGERLERFKSPNGVTIRELVIEFKRSRTFISQVVLNEIWREGR